MPVKYAAEFLEHSEVSNYVMSLHRYLFWKGQGDKSEIAINRAEYCKKP